MITLVKKTDNTIIQEYGDNQELNAWFDYLKLENHPSQIFKDSEMITDAFIIQPEPRDDGMIGTELTCDGSPIIFHGLSNDEIISSLEEIKEDIIRDNEPATWYMTSDLPIVGLWLSH